MDVNKFQNALEDLLKKAGAETAFLEGIEPQLGNTLRTLLPVTEAGDMVLTEVMMAPFTEDALLLQIYSTMIIEIGPGYEALKEMLLDWNLTAPLGAFGSSVSFTINIITSSRRMENQKKWQRKFFI